MTPEAAERFAAVTDRWSPELRAAFLDGAAEISAPDKAELFAPGAACEQFLLVLSGAVRVEHVNANGRAIVLYRVAPGGSCVMTTSCLLSGGAYAAFGHAEGEVRALALPAPRFTALLDRSAEFRTLAMSAFSDRIVELVAVIDDLLVNRVDLRLAGWLSARAAAGETIAATHQNIADEIGSAREVVSRVLKEFERRGWVTPGRGAVRVENHRALAALAASAPV